MAQKNIESAREFALTERVCRKYNELFPDYLFSRFIIKSRGHVPEYGRPRGRNHPGAPSTESGTTYSSTATAGSKTGTKLRAQVRRIRCGGA